MLYLLEGSLSPKIEALPFIERYGGIAYPLTHNFGGDTLKTFPVSQSLTAQQCFDQGKYVNLVPDDRYKSVAYLEGITSPAQIGFTDAKKGVAKITQNGKLVVWLNLQKLGITNPADIGLMALAAVDALQAVYAVTYAGVHGRMEVTAANIRLDKNGAFGGYTYVDKQALFMWPYGFFAVEFTAVINLPRRCLNAIENMEPLQCITQW